MLEMSIDSIRMSMVNYQRVVILKEKSSDRYLPIWIGSAEADAIAIKLQDFPVPRPLTHDLLHNMIKKLGASVDYIVVSDLRDDTFYAKIILFVNGNTLEVDSRPSDAIALAVRVKVPIYVEEIVLEKAGVYLDKETGKPIAPDKSPEKNQEKKDVDPDEMRRLSVFYDFIKTLDLGETDKGKDKGKGKGTDKS